MTKPSSLVAAAIKAAAGKDKVFVFASSKDSLPKDDAQLEKVLASVAMSDFGCTSCGTVVQARAGTSPFCITCGSGEEHVHVVEAKSKTEVTAKTDLTAMHCSTCDHHTMIQSSVVKSVQAAATGHPIYCSACGSEMHVTANPNSVEEPQKITQEWGQTDLKTPDAVDKSKTTAASDEGDDEEEDGDDKKLESGRMVASDDVFDEEDIALDDLEAAMSTPDSPDVHADQVCADNDLVLEPFEIEDDLDDLDGPLMSEDVAADADEMIVDDFGDEPEGDPLVDALSMDDTDVSLAFVQAGSRVIAMKGHVSVASFSRKSAGDNYRLMANTDVLAVAAKTAVHASGLRKGLESVGFALIRVPASTDAITSRKTTELTASFNKKRADEKKEFSAIFALAAAGLNRGEFRGYENPLRAAMESELSALGLRTPKRTVAAIFASSGLQYAQTLLEVSERLAKMSASARKELSEVLQMTNIKAASEDDESEEEDGDDEVNASTNVEARLNTTAALLRPKTVISASALNDASAVLAGKASLTFASV